MKLENQDQPTTQRLWIGGINPPNLTVEMVQNRIITSHGAQFEVLNFDDNIQKNDSRSKDMFGEDKRTFFFMTAKPKSPSNDSTEYKSPLQLISKQYNRVKWKGCVLHVEQAKLHFLQRLELERKEAMKIKSSEEIIQEDNSSNTQHQPSTMKSTKRHLRIRKQHGVEAFLVDTKPIETNDWKESMFTIKKQRSKYQKHENKLIEIRARKNPRLKTQAEKDDSLKLHGNYSLQSKSFLNRAVHLSIPTIDTEFVDFEKNEEGILKKNNLNNGNDTVHIDKEDFLTTSEDDVNLKGTEQENRNEESADESMSDNSETNKGEEYEWSDSDSEIESDEEQKDFDSGSITKLFSKQSHNAFDEFESAIIDQPTNFDDVDIKMNDEEQNMESLEDDVITNLKLLTHLYPDLKVRSRKENSAKEVLSTEKKLRPGWNPSGLIKRYDPNAKFEMNESENSIENDSHISKNDITLNSSEDDSNATSSEVEEEEDNGGDGKSSDEDLSFESIIPNGNPEENKRHIYEQKKLENIFQQERSGKGTTNFQLSSMFQLPDENNSAADGTKDDSKTESMFKFSFGTSDKNDEGKQAEEVNDQSKTTTKPLESYASEDDPLPTPAKLTERNKFFYSSTDLDTLQEKFFSLHGGIDFVLNLQRHPDQIDKEKEQWQNERKTLTLDWKRKHRYAQSKRKRVKFR